MASEGLGFCGEQVKTQAAIEERMDELTGEMLGQQMKEVLSVAMKEAYQHELFAAAIQDISKDFIATILGQEAKNTADFEMGSQAL